MKLVSLFGLFLYSQAVHSLTNIVGYIGESVTLPSRVEPSWVLNKIEWAIYPNNTWIATYREQTESLNRVPRYKGRLRLNTTTGDLTISNLNLNDAMEYSVDLSSDSENTVNKINLVVKQRPQQPVITQRQIITKSSCVVLLTCRSANQGADLSWSSTSFQGDNATLNTPDGLQLIFYTNSTQKASEFTCTSTVGSATASSDFTATCYGEKTVTTMNPPAPHIITSYWRDRGILLFFIGLILGAVLVIFLSCCLQGKLQSPGECLKGKCCSSKVSI